MTFPPFKFPFNGLAHEVRSVLVVTQDGVYPLECASSEPCLHVLCPKFFASHVFISHMRY